MIIVIDFKDALLEFAKELNVQPADTDSLMYVSDIFDLLVFASLDSKKGYKETVDNVISKIQYETGEPRSTVQSACDLAITQVLVKMDEIFVNVRHVDIFKTRKDIVKRGLGIYTLDLKTNVENQAYI